MPKILRNLRIDEISSVDRGAGEGVKILLMKRQDDDDLSQRPDFYRQFTAIDFDKLAEIEASNEADDVEDASAALPEKLEQYVNALLAAAPALSRAEAVHLLLHTHNGRALARHLSDITKQRNPPMSRIEGLTKLTKFIEEDPANMSSVSKLIISTGVTSLSEHEYVALVTTFARTSKRAGESVMAAFSRIFETDREIQQAHAICKSTNLMSIAPTQVGGADALDVNSARSKAYEALKSMAEEACRKSPATTFAAAFAALVENPAHAELATKALSRPSPTTSYPMPR